MPTSSIQTDLLETARSLILRDPDRFSVAALCRETGLSRAKMRQYFPNKAALMTALLEQEPDAHISDADEPDADEVSGEARAPAEIIGEGWIERRFRVFERALALLENRAEGATAEQSRALRMIEERLSGPVSTSLAELPPIVDAGKSQQKTSVPAPGIADEPAAMPGEPVALQPLEFHAAAAAFDARQKLRTILEKAPATVEAAPEKQKFLKDIPPWLMICGGLAGAALSLSVLFAVSAARNAPKPVAHPAQIAQAALKPDAPQKPVAYEPASHVVVIDATGANPQAVTPEIDLRAEHGDAHAKAEAALDYLRGENVEADAGAAMRWVQVAAAQGDATGQFILGSLYAKGMAPDPKHAAKWYAAAAAQGNVKAMHNLALAYLYGDGVEKNSATAIDWFTKAANSGYVDSAMNLAVLYDRGEEVGRSPREALRWYDQAAAQGDTEAGRRAGVLSRQLARMADR